MFPEIRIARLVLAASWYGWMAHLAKQCGTHERTSRSRRRKVLRPHARHKMFQFFAIFARRSPTALTVCFRAMSPTVRWLGNWFLWTLATVGLAFVILITLSSSIFTAF
jgi:hypothetical protein